jgi:cyclophilin family peptidyl-prolyl cis-trans isomerase
MKRAAVIIAVLTAGATTGAERTQVTHSTPFFVCGVDAPAPYPIPLTAENVVLAADGRLFAPCVNAGPHTGHREAMESDLLARAGRSPDPALRRLAARAYGQIAGGINLLALLRDPEPIVRLEAAHALGSASVASVAARPPTGDGHAALHAQYAREENDIVAGAILESLGRLNYATDAERDDLARFLASQRHAAAARVLGVAKGLEALIRKSPRWQLVPEARQRLRSIVADGGADLARSRRTAMSALQAARDDDVGTVLQASRDEDWQVRRLAAMRMDLARPEMASAAERLFHDPAFQVRYEMLGVLGRRVAQTKECEPLMARLGDPSPTVVLRALDVMPSSCVEGESITTRLVDLATPLTRDESRTNWHLPHAFSALARISAAEAKKLLPDAMKHAAWQVRATAATSAGLWGDEELAATLADDPEPNVRNAALEALSRLKSPRLTDAAVKALSSDDFQLIRTAAGVLRGTAEPLREGVNRALVQTLRRLTNGERDTSRDPRVAIIERLKELLDVNTASLVKPFIDDFDPRVREAAASAFASLLSMSDAPVPNPRHRYPYQPAAGALTQLPAAATIEMADGGIITLQLLPGEAPVTVARFAELVRAGYYNGLTFHRVVPNFVIQGGSPGANEYMGADRYWRDELGTEPHLRGSVGISTRGRDTGDGQIFIDLVDLPRLDHDYTVFARVIGGMDVVDRILEGATIKSVRIR